MKKSIRNIILILIMAASIILLGNVSNAYFFNKGGTYGAYGNYIRWGNYEIGAGEFANYLSQSATYQPYKNDFLNVPWNNIQGGGLSTYRGGEPISYKSTMCLVHQVATSYTGIYRISSVIDIDYDSSYKAVMLKVNGKNATRMYAGEMSYSMYLNDKYGTNVNRNDYKYAVDYYLKQGVVSGYIKVSSKFGQRSANDEPKMNLPSLYQQYLRNYSSRLYNYKQMKDTVEHNKYTTIEYTTYDVKDKAGNEYAMLGPFKLDLSTDNGIQSITVNGHKITNYTSDIYWTTPSISDYNNLSLWRNDWKSIWCNQYFYLAVKRSLLPQDNGSYKIRFDQVPLKYYKTRMVLLESTKYKQQLGTVVADQTVRKATPGSAEYTIKHIDGSGNLTISKKDATYKQDLNVNEDLSLGGAKVKIYTELSEGGKKGWLKKTVTSGGSSEYELTSYSEATEFETGDNGKISISLLKYGKYYVYEIGAPTGYNIKEQKDYKKESNGSKEIEDNDWVYLGSADISAGNGNVNLEAQNYKYTEIKGKVWLDVPDTKGNLSDNIYSNESNDQLLKGITVGLYDSRTGKEIGTTETNEKGEYTFNEKTIGRKITYWEAAYYYVEFMYDNQKYITARPFEGGEEKEENNSKAQEEEITNVELDDMNLTGSRKDTPTPGIAITYKQTKNNISKKEIDKNTKGEEKQKLLVGYYNEETYTIENINLGIVEKAETDHTIGEEIEYVKIQKGNYTYTYKYGEEAVTEEGEAQTTVKFQNSRKTFTQSVYPSDIKYNIANGLNNNSKEGYKIYVVYKIEIKNTTTTQYEEIYKEQALQITELTNKYDTTRYEISQDKLPGDEENIARDFKQWTGENGTAKYNTKDSNKKFEEGIKAGETESVYIEYKVKDEALEKLVTEEELGEAPTIVQTKGKHKYTRKDHNWKEEKEYTHQTKEEERENGSLYLKWNLFKTRTISGTIFEDSKESEKENERIGNGKYEKDKEKTITGVTISLMDAESGQEAYIYEEELEQNPGTKKWSRSKQKGITQADENGNYEIKGIVPGKYYLKYTYGDGKTETKDLNGNEIQIKTKKTGETNTINSNYYKSTIITGKAKEAENEKTWYLDNQEENSSIATDQKGTYYDKDGNEKEKNINIIQARTTSNKEINNTSSKDKVVIEATSPKIDIQLEYTKQQEYQITNNQLKELKTNCTGMNFGIIERPHTEIKLYKNIKNIKLTLSNGTTIINGNPQNQNISPYVTNINEGYAKIETDYINLYGSTISLEYNLTISNESEEDYATEEYYKTGNKNNEQAVETAITKIIDYTSNKTCNYIGSSENVELTENYENSEGYTKENYYEEGVLEHNKNYKTQLLKTEEQKLLPKSVDKEKSQCSYRVLVNQLMPSANEVKNLGWESYSEIIGIKNVTYLTQYTNHLGNYKVGDRQSYPTGTSESDNGDTVIAITPPTGSDRSYTIYIEAILSLLLVCIGVVIIKKSM